MKIKTILATKGSKVVTIRAEATLKEAVDPLAKNNIGAMVVVEEGGKPVGILSERDIVRGCYENGRGLSSMPVAWLMTRQVITASPEDEISEIMEVMTVHRVRHVPVMRDGRLQGLVSIGDVVKALLADSQDQIHYLKEFIHGPEA